MDTIWYHLYQIKSLIGSDYRFRNLFNVARLPFLTLHSNVGIERVYSFVNKNKKEGSDRNKLDIEGLLSAISAVKMDQPESFSNVITLNPVKNCLRKQRKLLPNAMAHIRLLCLKNKNWFFMKSRMNYVSTVSVAICLCSFCFCLY